MDSRQIQRRGYKTLSSLITQQNQLADQDTDQPLQPAKQQDDKSGNGKYSSNSTPSELTAASSPKPLIESERAHLNTQWQQRLAGAAQQAVVAGKMNASAARMIDRFLPSSSLPWRTLLPRYMSSISRTDYNFMRPSQRRQINHLWH